ncbi:uncharacterized protein CTHT_0030490 [Thermochaetoides thermophila DSM 1495]|uniref:CSN8/PSMD8/EIF3K domain-containing protein n=1 Tax=Chaetomium thermophilum (strain DSM 1495 / CBS 144.50 / IMI 039719) TaxID=759272 RepID=G0S3S7_CHATD|nr:hypothetical protein CTHT_0030490 [Thermochaetoides thermophila DSM 1495]EGS21203.1 hypothetical protein CTHT_0030490 [Thermochaetoides thermophila DSM 1495]
MHGRDGRADRDRRGSRGPRAQFSRLRPVELDPLAEFGLPSKGEKRLLNLKTQETYYSRIVERYLSFCTDAGDRDELRKQFASLSLADSPPSVPSVPAIPSHRQQSSLLSQDSLVTPGTDSTSYSSSHIPVPKDPKANLSQILSALRKLREALVATRRHDAFAAQVFLFAARVGVLVGSYETYLPALLYLLRRLSHYTIPDTRDKASLLTTAELRECATYLVLDAACRRDDLAEAYALRHTYRSALRFPSEVSPAKVIGFDRHDALDAVLHALTHDNWILFRRVKLSVDGPRARLMEFAEARMRSHTLKAFGRAYLNLPLNVLEEQVGKKWEELRSEDGVGWELEGERSSENAKVIIRSVRAR